MLRDLPSELKMNILDYSRNQGSEAVVASLAIDDATLLQGILDIDPVFSLLDLYYAYQADPYFSMAYYDSVVEVKQDMIKNHAGIIKLYDMIKKPNFNVIKRAAEVLEIYIFSLNANEMYITNSIDVDYDAIHRYMIDLFGEDVTYNALEKRFVITSVYTGAVYHDLVLWDRIVNCNSLLESKIPSKNYSSALLM